MNSKNYEEIIFDKDFINAAFDKYIPEDKMDNFDIVIKAANCLRNGPSEEYMNKYPTIFIGNDDFKSSIKILNNHIDKEAAIGIDIFLNETQLEDIRKWGNQDDEDN